MLTPETLSELLSKPVSRVNIHPMEHGGVAGGQLSRVDTDAGHFVLKKMSMDFDWVMFATNDHQCRAVTLWQYGLLDLLYPHADHKIIACAKEGNTWTIMMDDLAKNVFHSEKNPITTELARSLLDTLAKLHATFWSQPNLKAKQLGLCSPTEFIYSFSPSAGKKDSGQAQSAVKDWITLGWEVMEKLLDVNVFKHMLKLNEDPTPILKAMERFPFTLIHGDFKPDNLAYTDHLIILDWQLASFSIMTADLAWLTRTLEDLIEEKISIRIYRQCLETHLKQRFDDIDWRAMVELGYAVDALRSTSLIAYWSNVDENKDFRAINEKRVRSQGQSVMDALRWF